MVPAGRPKGSKSYLDQPPRIRQELAAQIEQSLRDRMRPLYEKTRDSLEVNRVGRKRPYYPFVPFHHHPTSFPKV
jgi:hypothetical protein